jgi:hypothetical protein
MNNPIDINERLMNCIYPDGICGNCICCMNKQLNPFCYEQNKSVQLDSIACQDYEYEKGELNYAKF